MYYLVGKLDIIRHDGVKFQTKLWSIRVSEMAPGISDMCEIISWYSELLKSIIRHYSEIIKQNICTLLFLAHLSFFLSILYIISHCSDIIMLI